MKTENTQKQKKLNNKKYPGCNPYLQGYWSYVWGQQRTPPEWHKHHDREFIKKWLAGYDDARIELLVRNSQTR